ERLIAEQVNGASLDGDRAAIVTKSSGLGSLCTMPCSDHYQVLDVNTLATIADFQAPAHESVGPPVLRGNIVAWSQQEIRTWAWDEHTDLYYYDLGTGQITQVTSNDVHHLDPHLEGTQLVWRDDTNGHDTGPEIYYFDIYAPDLSQGIAARD